MKPKIAFVINPNAGVKKKINIIDFIQTHFSKQISYEFIIWKDKDDFEYVKQQILKTQFDIVVACGGDGTVNKVASVVANTSMALAIFPLGSGNGLARSNQIPIDYKKALLKIEEANIKKIDAATLNGQLFFCTAGIGFDAHVAEKFASSTSRGFFTYVTTSIKEFFNYNVKHYNLTIDEQVIQTKAFLITVANAGQWGNDVYIAPLAKLNDGLLNISVLKPFSLINSLGIAIKLFTKKIHTSSSLISHQGKRIKIEFLGELPVHYDGEPIFIKDKIMIEVQPLALNIVC